ncbi:hypothetical protein [Desulfogranum japonicum]|uniref:hypothetical protein n=1 Tax=Desulfogranum japonicum TaxID=231447 RepID=UPI0004181A0E|nr:hypothetical protein [Desulfogranum japonicum]
MNARLLIISAPSPYFFYIPMGSFGVCDFLSKHNIQSKIFNPALYSSARIPTLLHEQLMQFKPTHVAIVCHWQETVHGLLEMMSLIKGLEPNVKLLAGGFTASYFSSSLMRHCPDLDFIIQGDPEKPLLDLLTAKPLTHIDNLSYRTGDIIARNDSVWLMDEMLLSTLSYSNLRHLNDWEKYIEKTNTKLGFPLLIGRGCIFDCAYCGGGRTAFRTHSSRNKPVQRSIEAILQDLHILKQYTDTLYICYENDQQYLVDLFQAIEQDVGLRQHFTLNYGAWHPIDDIFLNAYVQAFRIDDKKPIFEFSPEVISDRSRATIKGTLATTLKKTLESVAAIHNRLHGQVKIEIFFSRYHPTENQPSLLLAEIIQIYMLKHQLFKEHLFSAHICYDHLSTDVASNYWNTHTQGIEDFSLFLEKKQAIDEQSHYHFPMDNLCIYLPEEIPHEQLASLEALIHTLDTLEQRASELFHILFAAFSSSWVTVVKEIVAARVDKDGRDYFQQVPIIDLIQTLSETLATRYSREQRHYFPDLFRYTLQKLTLEEIHIERTENSKNTDCYILDQERVSTHSYNYVDTINFVNHIYNEQGVLKGYDRTVYLFLKDRIISLPHKTYRLTLRLFEQQLSKAQYISRLRELPGIDLQLHEELMEILIQHGILLPCS